MPALDCEDHVTAASLAPSEETVALAVAGSQLLAFDLAHASVKDELSVFTPLGPAAHGPPLLARPAPAHTTTSAPCWAWTRRCASPS